MLNYSTAIAVVSKWFTWICEGVVTLPHVEFYVVAFHIFTFCWGLSECKGHRRESSRKEALFRAGNLSRLFACFCFVPAAILLATLIK